MNRKELLLQEIKAFKLPTYNEIPNVGLFLEQVTKYITDYMAPIESVSLTGSMISNYVKKGIINNPTRKQYGREQIAELIFIALAKTVLSLEDIQQVLKMIPEDTEPEKTYEHFRKEMFNTLNIVFDGEGAAKPEKTAAKTAEGQVLSHTAITISHKIYLDKYFKALRNEVQE